MSSGIQLWLMVIIIRVVKHYGLRPEHDAGNNWQHYMGSIDVKPFATSDCYAAALIRYVFSRQSQLMATAVSKGFKAHTGSYNA